MFPEIHQSVKKEDTESEVRRINKEVAMRNVAFVISLGTCKMTVTDFLSVRYCI